MDWFFPLGIKRLPNVRSHSAVIEMMWGDKQKNPSNRSWTDFLNISCGLPNEIKGDVAWDTCFVHLCDVSCESLADACILSSI